MKPQDDIIRQLDQQGIQYEVLQERYHPKADGKLSEVMQLWHSRFIGTDTAPNLDQYLWQIFSYNVTAHSEGPKAIDALEKQFDTDTFIFNEAQQYLIKCLDRIPKIEMDDFNDDIYICHHNMKWTFVIPHEVHSGMGPYFSTGKKYKLHTTTE